MVKSIFTSDWDILKGSRIRRWPNKDDPRGYSFEANVLSMDEAKAFEKYCLRMIRANKNQTYRIVRDMNE